VCEFAIASAALAKDSESTLVPQGACLMASVSGEEGFPAKYRTGIFAEHSENAGQIDYELGMRVKGESSW